MNSLNTWPYFKRADRHPVYYIIYVGKKMTMTINSLPQTVTVTCNATVVTVTVLVAYSGAWF